MPINIDALLLRDLEYAAMNFKKRNYFLYRALHKYCSFNKLSAISYIRFSPILVNGHDILYVGPEQDAFHKWVQPLIAESLEKTLVNFSNTNWNLPLKAGTISTYEQGILITWSNQNNEQNKTVTHLFFEGLKAISYVELNEYKYF